MEKEILQYIINHTDREDDVLAKLSRETHLKTVQPRMLSGHYQGKLLEFISKMIHPEKILEIGTFTGYSAICLAKGLKDGGLLYTIEVNDERENIIKKYIEKSGMESKIKLLIGDAKDIIPKFEETFDLVFIDADKSEYLGYYKAVTDKVRKGGFIIADNVLWDGKVIENIQEDDESTKGIVSFNDFVRNDKRVEKIILPIRDGLMLIRKK